MNNSQDCPLGHLAGELYAAGNYEAAEEAYAKMTEESPSDAKAWRGLTASLVKQDKCEAAIVAANTGLTHCDHPHVRYNVALAFQKLGRLTEALAMLEKALEFAPDDYAILSLLVELRRDLKMYDDALRTMERIYDLWGRSEDFLKVCRLWIDKGDFARAVELLEGNPLEGEIDYYGLLIKAYCELAQYASAVRAAKAILALDNSDLFAARCLVESYMLAGDPSNAVLWAEKLDVRNRGDVYFLFQYARALRQAGQLESALEVLDACERLGCDYDDLYFEQGMCALLSRDIAEARRQLAYLRATESADLAQELEEKVAEYQACTSHFPDQDR
jgi:tetratricopeptide (TPR) repeat protein